MSPWKPERHLLGNLYIITLETLRTFTWKTWEPWGNLYNTTLGTLTTFTWETWESWGNLYNATLESLRKPWQYNLGTLENLYNVTLGTLREPLQCNLGKLEETLTILPWNPWEPLQCNLGNLEGTFTIQPWEPWKTWEPSGNLEETFKKPSGNLEETLREPWQSNLGIPWESYRNLYNVTLGTWTTFTWEPLHNNLGNLDNLYLENLGTLQGTLKEPWETWGNLFEPFWNLEGTLRNLGNLYLGTFKWEPLLGTWEPWGNGFWSCSGLLRNLYYGWRPQSILLLGKKDVGEPYVVKIEHITDIHEKTCWTCPKMVRGSEIPSRFGASCRCFWSSKRSPKTWLPRPVDHIDHCRWLEIHQIHPSCVVELPKTIKNRTK